MSENQSCSACGSQELVRLPSPHPNASVLSDGRTAPQAMRKASCQRCGLVSHIPPLAEEVVRGFYDSSYELGLTGGEQEAQRASRYARCLADLLHQRSIKRALEVGCGAGHVLSALSEQWPSAFFVGLDAAPRHAVTRNSGPRQIEIRQGFVDDFHETEPFDLIYGIGVFEHAADPRRFLNAMKNFLAPDGLIVLIFPKADPVNLELLFLDHVHTITQSSLEHWVLGHGYASRGTLRARRA